MSKEQSISFTIQGEPVSKARARVYPVYNKNKKLIMRNDKPVMSSKTPASTRAWESYVGAIARVIAAKERFREPHKGPVILGCMFLEKIPTSWSLKRKKDALAGDMLPTSKRDLSNMVKSIEDALEGVFYVNDKQIVGYESLDKERCLWRLYSDNPRVEVRLRFL